MLLGVQLAYQFWIHSQHIGRLGWLEKVLVTPSLHRVHHGQNPRYIDRNHGGVFIFWDRLFGTWQEEDEPVVYGVTTPVRTFDPLRLQFSWWRLLWADARATAPGGTSCGCGGCPPAGARRTCASIPGRRWTGPAMSRATGRA